MTGLANLQTLSQVTSVQKLTIISADERLREKTGVKMVLNRVQ
jgi:hypothetical protein